MSKHQRERIRQTLARESQQDARVKQDIRSAIEEHDRAFLHGIITVMMQKFGWPIPSLLWMKRAIDFSLPLLNRPSSTTEED